MHSVVMDNSRSVEAVWLCHHQLCVEVRLAENKTEGYKGTNRPEATVNTFATHRSEQLCVSRCV